MLTHMNIYTTNKCIHIKVISFLKNVAEFSWLFLYPYRGMGLSQLKRGCVLHCVITITKNKQKGQFYKWRKQVLLTSFFNGPRLTRYLPIGNSILNKVSVALYIGGIYGGTTVKPQLRKCTLQTIMHLECCLGCPVTVVLVVCLLRMVSSAAQLG